MTFIIIILSFFLVCPTITSAFAILAHEAVIDIEWDRSIKPLLKKKFHKLSDSALKEAHSYAFGGSIISDIGYYPLGSSFFTNLVHYVKSGDFINNLIDEAKDVNEYAFALGVLSHYYTDKYGHPNCTNHAVPILFPETKNEFGDIVSYEQAEMAHTRVEYGLDVVQTAIGNYESDDFHGFIGFQISQSLLERAFLKTYKLELKSVFISLPTAISIFRFTVNHILPELTRNAWRIRKSMLSNLNPLEGESKYDYKIDEEAYEKEFGTVPIKAIILSFIIGIIPKIGPLEIYKYQEPSPEVMEVFKKTMKTITLNFSKHLKKLVYSNPKLENINLDTGKKSIPKDYKIADETNDELLEKIKDK